VQSDKSLFLRFELSSRLDVGSLTFGELVNHFRLMSANFPVVMTYFIQELVDSSERDPSSNTTVDEVEALLLAPRIYVTLTMPI
jgi:hypothetical protein